MVEDPTNPKRPADWAARVAEVVDLEDGSPLIVRDERTRNSQQCLEYGLTLEAALGEITNGAIVRSEAADAKASEHVALANEHIAAANDLAARATKALEQAAVVDAKNAELTARVAELEAGPESASFRSKITFGLLK